MPERPGSIPDVSLPALLVDLRNDMRDMRRETSEGITSLDGKFDRLDEKLEDHARELRGEIAAVRDGHARTAEKVAKIIGERAGEERAFGANGTGRFNVVPEHGSNPQLGSAMFIPTPPAGVPMELKYGRKSESSRPPAVLRWVAKAFGGTAGKIIGGALVTAAAGVGGAWFHAAIVPVETRIVQVPASTSVAVAAPVATVSQVAVESAAASAPVLDAGTVVRGAKKPTTHP